MMPLKDMKTNFMVDAPVPYMGQKHYWAIFIGLSTSTPVGLFSSHQAAADYQHKLGMGVIRRLEVVL